MGVLYACNISSSPLAWVRTPSSPVRERKRERERGRERKGERVRKSEKDGERERVFILKGMTVALPPFSYLVLLNFVSHHKRSCLKSIIICSKWVMGE